MKAKEVEIVSVELLDHNEDNLINIIKEATSNYTEEYYIDKVTLEITDKEWNEEYRDYLLSGFMYIHVAKMSNLSDLTLYKLEVSND